MGNSYNSYGEFSKLPVRPYRNCTGQVWFGPKDSHLQDGESFGPYGRLAVQFLVRPLTEI